jgi:uncharacterized protein
MIFTQEADLDPEAAAAAFVDAEKGVASVEEALAGARDIIAERINESEEARSRMRAFFAEKAVFQSRVVPGKEAEGSRFRDWFDWEAPAARAPSHRLLAMRRGEKEEFLFLRVVPPETEALAILLEMFVTGVGAASEQVRLSVEDGYRRLLCPAMETEIRLATKKRADTERSGLCRESPATPPGPAPRAEAAPRPGSGFRTGCKLVCLDAQGKLLHPRHDLSPPLRAGPGARRRSGAGTLRETSGRGRRRRERYGGAGDGGLPPEIGLPEAVAVVMVNESGASVYSARRSPGRNSRP